MNNIKELVEIASYDPRNFEDDGSVHWDSVRASAFFALEGAGLTITAADYLVMETELDAIKEAGSTQPI